MKKKILWVFVFIFVLIQFIRPEKNRSKTISSNDITKHYSVPQNVQDIFKRACNDCHTNSTVYPWYSEVQPVAWWLQDHVNEGKKELNFSEFAAYPPKRQHHKLEEVIEQVKDGHMPLNSYLWVHKDAKLNEDEKKTIAVWASVLMEQIAAKHNLGKE